MDILKKYNQDKCNIYFSFTITGEKTKFKFQTISLLFKAERDHSG